MWRVGLGLGIGISLRHGVRVERFKGVGRFWVWGGRLRGWDSLFWVWWDTIAISWRQRFSFTQKRLLSALRVAEFFHILKDKRNLIWLPIPTFRLLNLTFKSPSNLPSWKGWICQFIQSHSQAPAFCTSKVAFARFRKLFWDSPRRTWFRFSTSPNSRSSLQKVP